MGVIAAWDADDTSEGTNAKLIYSIEKNVIHERTGEAIFRVNPETGLIQTALCCLDRETTPEYNIQVVATDGGGLKGGCGGGCVEAAGECLGGLILLGGGDIHLHSWCNE